MPEPENGGTPHVLPAAHVNYARFELPHRRFQFRRSAALAARVKLALHATCASSAEAHWKHLAVFSPDVVDTSSRCGAGLFECCGAGQRARLADQCLEVVVEFEVGFESAGEPVVLSDLAGGRRRSPGRWCAAGPGPAGRSAGPAPSPAGSQRTPRTLLRGMLPLPQTSSTHRLILRRSWWVQNFLEPIP